MSIEGKDLENQVEDAMAKLLAGREPSAAALARAPTLKAWHLRVKHDAADRRRIMIEGTLASERFTVKDQPRMPVHVLWMDRKWRFALTKLGLWNLGKRESDTL